MDFHTGRKKGMMVDCDGVVISVQETTTKYALRKLWRGVPVQRAYVYCVKTCVEMPSSRRRVDGVEVDATIQHERAIKF